MKNKNHNGKVLQDHKKVGKKLVPPIMQIPNLKEMSFRDNTLPCLIWLSAFFLRVKDRVAVNITIDFLKNIQKILADDKIPALVFLNNFNKLTTKQKTSIVSEFDDKQMLNFLREKLVHQYHLIKDYPLSFLFEDYEYGVERDEAIHMLKEDVGALLDRHTIHSTKVQTTAFISMSATGKLFLSSTIDLPNFDSIFTDPESDESNRVGSFVRANINAGADFQHNNDGKNAWANTFWEQSFLMERCN